MEIKEDLDIVSKKQEIIKFFGEYLEFGSFPGVVISDTNYQKITILQQYFEDVFEKDIADRYQIRRKDKLTTLSKFYLTNISNSITFRKIEKFLKIPFLTIEKFSEYIQLAYLFF